MPDVAIKVIAKDQASATLGKVGGSLQKLGKVAKVAGLLGVAALAGIALGAAKLAKDAAKLEPTRVTFDNLTKSIGTTADAMLKKLRPATMGIVADADLMQAANKLMAMGLAETEEEAARLSEMAVTLGMAMGEEATPSMENFALMLANQSIPRLDSFGISSSKVRERILELMAETEGLSRETAFMTAVMEQGEDAMSRVGDISETGAVKMAQFQATITNLKDTVGKALLPVFHAFMDKIMTPLAKKLEEMVPKVEMLISVFSDLITEVFGADMERAIGFLENEVWEVLDHVFGEEMASKIVGFGKKVLEWIGVFQDEVIPTLRSLGQDILPVVTDNVDIFYGVLAGAAAFAAIAQALSLITKLTSAFHLMGAASAAAGGPIAAIVAALGGPLVIAIGVVAAGIGLLVVAWKRDWGGIQEKVRTAWEDIIRPTLEGLGQKLVWLRDNILSPLGVAFGQVWAFIEEVVKTAWEGFKPAIDEMHNVLAEYWEEIQPKLEEAWLAFKTAMAEVGELISTIIVPLLGDLWDRLEPVRELVLILARAVGVLAGMTALALVVVVLESFIAVLNLVIYGIDTVALAVAALTRNLAPLVAAFTRVKDAIPPWLLPGSMAPLESSLRGIADAFRDMNVAIGIQPSPGMTPALATTGGDVHIHTSLGGVYGIEGAEEAMDEVVRDAVRYSL